MRAFIYRAVYRLYHMLKPRLRHFVRKHPRLYTFACVQRGAFIQLLRPNDNEQAELALLDMRKKATVLVPDFLVSEIESVHRIEPLIRADDYRGQLVLPFLVANTGIGASYWRLVRECGPARKRVILVPWLAKGGADLVVLNYLNALVLLGEAKNTLVISTLDEDSPWADRVPEGVKFVEFGKLTKGFSGEDQTFLLCRLMLQMKPAVIHNINSRLTYDLFVKYGRALSSYSKLYSQVFCIDLDVGGTYAGYPVSQLPDCFDFLTGLISENRTVLELLKDMYAFKDEKLFVHYQPVSFPVEESVSQEELARKLQKKELAVLWCSRIDRQKRPDVLVKIIEQSQELPIVFHVYGAPMLDTDKQVLKALHSLPNVQFHGSYDGFHSLPFAELDIMLYTSEWDGIPTVLFEGMAVGLPIVAANVGGIAELIEDGNTGLLIEPYDNPDAYIKALKKMVEDRNLMKKIINNAAEHIRSRHNMDNFLLDIQQLPFYL